MTISGEPTVSRRRLLTYGAVTGAAVALAPTIPGLTPPASASGVPDVLPLPEPIPGGFTLPDGTVFHVLPPGPPTVTLPFSQLPLQGLDVEPSVITDYAGFTCLAFHAGSATGSDGRQYNLETDMRVMDGTYRTADGSRRHGAFAFI